MKKLIFFLPLFVFAAFVDFSPCLKKYNFIENLIPVSKNLSVTFNKNNCFEYDPFTGICVIKQKNKKVVKFFYKPKLAWWMASIKKDEIYVGNYAKKALDLYPAKLSVKVANNSIITDMFCRAIGVGSKDGFFLIEYIRHFSKYKYWGDVGIVVDKDFRVKYVDPFFVKGFKLGEKIKTINKNRRHSGLKMSSVKTRTAHSRDRWHQGVKSESLHQNLENNSVN